jgi:hypothetical protein
VERGAIQWEKAMARHTNMSHNASKCGMWRVVLFDEKVNPVVRPDHPVCMHPHG